MPDGEKPDDTLYTPVPAPATGGGPGRTRVDVDEAYCPACNESFPLTAEKCPKDGARLVKLKASRDPLIGRVFDNRYEIRTLLGEGGMGSVYRGWQLSVDREVAIKVVHPSIASDRTAAKRFLRESRLSSRLSQPSIVNVYDFGQTDDGVLYLVMELLRGHTLAHDLEPKRPLPLRRVITIGLQLCDALEAAHTSPTTIIHRDLKPGNIVVLDDPPGRDLIKVLDFGLAKSLVNDSMTNVTHTNAILGTPLYMSPEQIENRNVDQRSDLYALGCILFHMVTGRPPFLADNATLVLAAHLGDDVPLKLIPATTPRALVLLVEKLMAKTADQRLASAGLVRDALQQIADAGYGASDLSDTTPDIPPMAAPGVRPSVDNIGLAMTDQALARPAAKGATPPPTLETTARPAASGSSLKWLVLAGVAVIAIVGAVAIVVMMTKAKSQITPPSTAIDSPRPDAARAPDAMAMTVVVDAPTAVAIDAPPPAAILDAPIRKLHNPPPVVVHRDAPPVARPDAATAPDINFLPTPKK